MSTFPKTVATHSGPFHCDDLVAYIVLRLIGLIGAFVRTRDPKTIEAADIAFDVGASYDHARGRYDHHQPGGAGTRDNGVPYAAAGLVWRHFGVEFCGGYATRFGVDAQALANAVDESVIQGVDAMDTGSLKGFWPVLKGNAAVEVQVQSLSTLASAFNPASLIEDNSPAAFDAAFQRAADAVQPLLERLIAGEASRLKAEEVVRKCDSGTPVMVLDPFCPWQDVVVASMPHVLLVVFRNPEGTWMVQVVPAAFGSFDARKSLPAPWAGLRDAPLAQLTGVADAVFCHPGKFICGAKSREGALRLAELALQP